MKALVDGVIARTNSILAFPESPLIDNGKNVSRPLSSSETRRKAWWGRAALLSSFSDRVSLRVSRGARVSGSEIGFVAEKL